MNKILLLIFLCFGVSAFAQTRTTPYDFPVKPGTEEWKKLKSGEEMTKVCNIPDSVLTSLTTEALAKTSLNYPLLNEVSYASNLQKGMEGVIRNSNALTELLKRKDAGTELFKIYKGKNAGNPVENLSEVQRGFFTLEFTYLELLLSQPQILNSLNSKERIMLAKEAVIKYDAKKEKSDVFGEFGLTTSVLVVAKILNAENKMNGVLKTVSQKEIDIFLATGMYNNTLTLSAIYNAGKSL